MGKGNITSAIGAGKYSLEIIRDIQRAEKEITTLTKKNIILTNTTIPDLTTIYNKSRGTLKAANQKLNAAIQDYIAESITKDQLRVHVKIQLITQRELSQADTNLNVASIQVTSNTKKIELLEDVLPTDTIDVWCADFTTDLAGEVATIEVPGERQTGKVFIRPGHDGNSTYNSAREGQLQPVPVNTPAGSFHAAALLSGVERWRPQYRTGIITAIADDNSACSVGLHKQISSVQNMSVNPDSNVLTNIPFEYMTCNGGAFSVGDSVIVEFTNRDWLQPKVIGFTHDPKGCVLKFRITRDDSTVITDVHAFTFFIRNSSKTWLTVDSEYDVETQYWTLTIEEDFPEDGVEVFFNCIDSVWTKYPYKYKWDDYNPVNSLLQLGTYEAAIPYWVVGGPYYMPTRLPWNPCDPCVDVVGDAWVSQYHHMIVDHFDAAFVQHSSIPYKIIFNLSVEFARSSYLNEEEECHFCFPCGYTIKSDCGQVSVEWGKAGGDLFEKGSTVFSGVIGGAIHKYIIQNTFVECFLGKDEINLCLNSANFGMWAVYDY